MRRVRAYIGLGSNVGEPAITLARAVAALEALPGSRLRGVSPLYATTPVGVTDQPDFHNAVAALDVPAGEAPEAGALVLLRQLKGLEADFGRTAGPRWGPRVLDLDLLLFGRACVLVERPLAPAGRNDQPSRDESGPSAGAGRAGAGGMTAAIGAPAEPTLLQVPHRDVADRLFVLAPLSDLAPRLVPPGWHETVATARRRRAVIEGEAAARVTGTWDDHRRVWV